MNTTNSLDSSDVWTLCFVHSMQFKSQMKIKYEVTVGIHEIEDIRLKKACFSFKGAVDECLGERPFK